MKVGVITLFPEMFAALNYGVIGRAIEHNIVQLTCWQLRDFTHDKHHSVDDRPYGGGPGMILMVEPIAKAFKTIKKNKKSRVIMLTPAGKKFTQRILQEYKPKKI